MYELSTVKPHLGKTPSFTAATWEVYCDGYYTALCWSLRVMAFALEQRARRQKEHRRRAAEKRAAAPRSDAPQTYQFTAVVEMLVDQLVEDRPQGHERDEWKAKYIAILRHTFDALEFDKPVVPSGDRPLRGAVDTDESLHSSEYRSGPPDTQLKTFTK